MTLNSVLSLWGESPAVLGGHRPEDAAIYSQIQETYMSQRIEVRPDTWLPFFHKTRWWDLRSEGTPDKIERADGTTFKIGRWTVDDPRIWCEVEFITEIANRILMTLIRDRNPWYD